jgi:hypothetical protein
MYLLLLGAAEIYRHFDKYFSYDVLYFVEVMLLVTVLSLLHLPNCCVT